MKDSRYFISWSSGKDAAMALHFSENKPDLLLTTVNHHFQRVSMHGLRISLLEAQAEALGIPLKKIELPEQPSMEEYEQRLLKGYDELKELGYTHAIFGDIFLEDLKKYRDEQLGKIEFQGVYPIWKKDTKHLISDFIEAGFRAIIVCIKSDLLDQSFLGKEIDQDFLEKLPSNVDPCGENGEFHTFCFDGPIFQYPLKLRTGEATFREYKDPTGSKEGMGFWFLDLEIEKE